MIITNAASKKFSKLKNITLNKMKEMLVKWIIIDRISSKKFRLLKTITIQ